MYNYVEYKYFVRFRKVLMSVCIFIFTLALCLAPIGTSLAATGSVSASSLATSSVSASSAAAALAATLLDTEPPTVPDGLSAANRTYTSIVLLWKESIDNIKVRGYQVFRDGKKIITTSKTIFTNTDLIPDREYTYIIKAYDAAGNVSGSSTPLVVRTVADFVSPSAPGALFASSRSFTSISLTWKPSNDNSGLKGYVVYCNGVKKASTSATSYVCKGFLPGKTYSFFVKAVDRADNYSVQSNIITAATPDDAVTPSAPSEIKTASVSETEANLLWSPSSDNVKVKCYEIYLDGAKKSSTTKTSYKVVSLAPGKSYIFTIKAIDVAGNQSVMSSQLKVTTINDLKAPDAPTGLKVNSVSGATVSLSWNAAKDNVKIKGYRVYCNGLVVADTSRTTRTVRNPTGLPIGFYWVKAYDLVDNTSPASNIVTVLNP